MENFIEEFAPHFEEIYIKEPYYDEDTEAESPATYEEWSDNQSSSQISPAWPVNVDDSDTDSQEITILDELFKCKVVGDNAAKMPVPIEFPVLKEDSGADVELDEPRTIHVKVEPIPIQFPIIKEEPSSDIQTAETIPGADSDEDCIIIEENNSPQGILAQASEIVADTNEGAPVVVVGVTEGTSSGAPIVIDPKSRKLIQHHLILLLHANWCMRREKFVSGECTLPHCRKMKELLEHMKTCQLGKSCSKSLCSSSRVVISHWMECTNTACDVCAPIVQAEEMELRQNGLQLVDMGVIEGNPHGGQTIPNPKTKLMQLHLRHLLHANRCQIRECLNSGVLRQCSLPHCREMKNLLVHMMVCRSGRSCSVRFCPSSHEVITHWMHCTNPICSLCVPVRQSEKQESQLYGTLAREVSQSSFQTTIPLPPAQPVASKHLKTIHTQLVLLLHAQKCKHEIQTNGQIRQCELPHCRKTKILLNHMATCKVGKSCSVPLCVLSCQIITHWASCISSECLLCLPCFSLKQRGNIHYQQIVAVNQAPNYSPNFMKEAQVKMMAPVNNLAEGSLILDTPGLTPSHSQDGSQETIIKMLPFSCGMCSKSFTNNNDLYLHQGKHHIGNSFRCNPCGLSFYCHTNFYKHEVLHFRQKTSSLASVKPYSMEKRPTSHNRINLREKSLYSATALAGQSDARIISLSTTAAAMLERRPSDATFVVSGSQTQPLSE